MQFIADYQLPITLFLGVIITTVIWWFEKRARDIEKNSQDKKNGLKK